MTNNTETTTIEELATEITATPYRATLILEARDESGGYTSQMQAHIATEMGEIGYGVEWMPASEVGQYRTLHPSEPVVTAGDLNDRDWEILNSAISEAWGL